MLEKDHLRESGFMSARSSHLIASAMQQAFVDRAEYLGDPDFYKVPTKELISKAYGERVRKLFTDKARHVDDVKPGDLAGAADEHTETTHISLINDKGDMVATTQTINGWFGSGLVVAGTGVLLNNEMDDFSAQAGVPNLFGAVGKEANAIAPLKTPLSSMSPTLVLKDDEEDDGSGKPRESKPLLAVGAPGGTRIITCVTEVLLNYLEYETSLFDAITRPRMHHQWRPDVLFVDPPGFRKDVTSRLQEVGYEIKVEPVPCRVMGAAKEGKHVHAVSDPRDHGAAAAY
jgi:gamma-glutamyltranspeptidase/glutathione hydrolase